MEEKLDRLTEMTLSQRKEALRWMARQSENTQTAIMKSRFKILKKLKEEHCNPTDSLDLAALCLACGYNGFYADKKYRSSSSLTEAEIRNITKRRISAAREMTEQRDLIPSKLDKLWGEVVELRREGFSFKKIADYLLLQHKFSVHRSTVHSYWKKWDHHGKLPLD